MNLDYKWVMDTINKADTMMGVELHINLHQPHWNALNVAMLMGHLVNKKYSFQYIEGNDIFNNKLIISRKHKKNATDDLYQK